MTRGDELLAILAVAGALLVGGAALETWGVPLVRGEHLERWMVTDCQVNGARVVQWQAGGQGYCRPEVTFTYVSGGQTHVSTVYSLRESYPIDQLEQVQALVARYPLGSAAVCRVSPATPGVAVLSLETAVPHRWWFDWVLIGVVVVFCLGLALAGIWLTAAPSQRRRQCRQALLLAPLSLGLPGFGCLVGTIGCFHPRHRGSALAQLVLGFPWVYLLLRTPDGLLDLLQDPLFLAAVLGGATVLLVLAALLLYLTRQRAPRMVEHQEALEQLAGRLTGGRLERQVGTPGHLLEGVEVRGHRHGRLVQVDFHRPQGSEQVWLRLRAELTDPGGERIHRPGIGPVDPVYSLEAEGLQPERTSAGVLQAQKPVERRDLSGQSLAWLLEMMVYAAETWAAEGEERSWLYVRDELARPGHRERVRAAYKVGLNRGDRGEHARAIRFYGHALELDPTFGLAYRERASLYLAEGRTDLARRDLERYLSCSPADVWDRERLEAQLAELQAPGPHR